jgi:hypothetical protein
VFKKLLPPCFSVREGPAPARREEPPDERQRTHRQDNGIKPPPTAQRLAPGFYADPATGGTYFIAGEYLAGHGLPDTPENRKKVADAFEQILIEQG